MPGQRWDGMAAKLLPRRGMQSMDHRRSLASGGVTTMIELSGAVNMTGYLVLSMVTFENSVLC